MARYIDADKLLKNVKDATPMNWTNSEAEIQAQLNWKCCIALIKNQPTADVAEVKHGEWLHLCGDEWCCTNCGEVITTEGSWEKPTKKYCNECGAKMDGGDEE